ncbi:PREDICTED: longitudinals lacking protein, isoforms A/B/D/L-like [Nicrophorus vespilloides]|uniref:Longitudinals lacking protein, isoforms A/B/D/L-like n=1 Tax=Nicrophorus vespilloides TaxID=110193 RepID=A0ABM1N9L3_NICVS|nr:PREDICTED: longitudinals lacking protein, isoforms A/B/D/L-like [Nicrophorus vespilloides]
MPQFSNAFACIQCGKVYRGGATLKRHQRYECGKAPEYSCKVGNCSYKSKYKFTLRNHMIAKHGVIMTKPDTPYK